MHKAPPWATLLEQSDVAFATVDEKGNPHVIAVKYAKYKDGKIVITDVMMRKAKENLLRCPKVCLAFWDPEKEKGWRIKGVAEYHVNNEWHEFVKNLPENKSLAEEGLEPKGAVVVTPTEVDTLG